MTTFKSCNKEEFKELVSLYLNPRLHECECEWRNDSLNLMITNRISHKCILTVRLDAYEDDYDNVTCNLKDVLNTVYYTAIGKLDGIFWSKNIYNAEWIKSINELSQMGMELKDWIDFLEKTEQNERKIES